MRAAKTTDSESSSPIAATIQASVTSLACVWAASFGVPVVPPVGRAARSVADGASPTKRPDGCSAASADRWPTRTPSIRVQLRPPGPPRGAQREQALIPASTSSRAFSQTSARVGTRSHEHAAPDLAQQLGDVLGTGHC